MKYPTKTHTSTLLLLFTFSILTGCTSEQKIENLPIMGDLEPGEHSTGYQTLFVYDKTRSGIPFSDWDGKVYKDYDEEKGRQFQINLWYPAKKGTGNQMKYHHYVHLSGQQTNFEKSEAQDEFAEQLFISHTNDLGGNGAFTQDELDKLLKLDVSARLDATTQKGKFPVILIPGGSTSANHSILAEFLAGHGYLVAGFAPKGRFSFGLETSTIGLETGVDDLEFVLNQISNFPFADMEKVAVIGNAISSSIGALAVSKNGKIKALVSLEGGLPSAFEQRLLSKSIFYTPENFQVPSLFIYAPHPDIDPKHTFHLKHSDRYYVHFPFMSEFAMLNYGMFDSFVPDIIGEHEKPTQQGFETAVRLVLRFLNKTIRGENHPVLDNEFLTASTGIIDSTFILESVPAPPDMAELKGIFVEHGFSAIDSIYSMLVQSGNPQPFSRPFFADYRDWLSWKKDPQYQNRRKLYNLAFQSFPESAVINYYAGYFAEVTDDSLQMKKHYKKALQLIDDENDQTLTPSEKRAILRNIKEAMK